MRSCEECNAECCRYVTADIDAPKDKDAWDEIRWYVMHENVYVYQDNDGEWHVEFRTPCKNLGVDNKCLIYDKRPLVCRDHNVEECDINCDCVKIMFRCAEDVDRFLRKAKKSKNL